MSDWKEHVRDAITVITDDVAGDPIESVEAALDQMSHDKEVGAKDYVQRAKSELEHEKGSSDRAVSFLETGLREGGEAA